MMFIVGMALALYASPATGAVPEAAVALTRAAIASSPDSVAAFDAALSADGDEVLAAFWKQRNPLVYKYYFGHLAGERRYTVSDVYFDRWSRIPDLFKLETSSFREETLDEAITFTRELVAKLPSEPVAHCAFGYVLLERGEYEEADGAFLEALKIDRKLAEARNGRGLAILRIILLDRRPTLATPESHGSHGRGHR